MDFLNEFKTQTMHNYLSELEACGLGVRLANDPSLELQTVPVKYDLNTTESNVNGLRKELTYIADEEERNVSLVLLSKSLDKSLTDKFPIVMYLPGGGIGRDDISKYLPQLVAEGMNALICGVIPEAQKNHIIKTRNSIYYRMQEALAALMYMYQNYKDSWNGEVCFIGDSLGGAVAAELSRIMVNPPNLLLTEPAAYSQLAHAASMQNYIKGDLISSIKKILKVDESDQIEVDNVNKFKPNYESRSVLVNGREYYDGSIVKITLPSKYTPNETYAVLSFDEEGESIWKVVESKEDAESILNFTTVLRRNPDDKEPQNLDEGLLLDNGHLIKNDSFSSADSFSWQGIQRCLRLGKKVTVCLMKEDTVVSEQIRDRFVSAAGQSNVLIVDGDHGSTSPAEIERFVEFVNELK